MAFKKNKILSVLILLSIGILSSFRLSAATMESEIEQKQYILAYQAKGSDYNPRTEHFNADGTPKYINRLIFEESPYLIQHAHNPVNWYAWGAEAFAQAKKQNKPIFLSIGYSTCHWCHVMERESFDNEVIAAYLNQHFIAIKVDRERRPDVDKTYMTALTLLNGSGGWPMSSLLTPEGKPFYAGTYYPPMSFMQVLTQIVELWKADEQRLRKIGDKIALTVQDYQKGEKQAANISEEQIQLAAIQLMNRFDDLQGGFSHAPKFPNETYLFLLLDRAIRDQNQEILEALKLTMSLMAQGGIYDQIGGGFHRYSTDNEWLAPHFEKMLYNQGHLVRNYLALYEITQDIYYKTIVEQTLTYVLAEMQTSEGVFYSAGDADSEGEEGKFFLWTQEQIKQSLPADLATLAIDLYALKKEGNFSEHSATEATSDGNVGTSILNLPVSMAEYAKEHKIELSKLYQRTNKIRKSLYEKRQARIAPAIDKKIVTAWNAMMITAFTKAGMSLTNSHYIDVAKKAAHYLWDVHMQCIPPLSSELPAQHNTRKEGQSSPLCRVKSGLLRVSLNGRASVAGTQADYAYLAQAYIALFDATQEKIWLEYAQQLTQEMIEYFWDENEGTFFMSREISNSSQDVPLFSRPKDLYDGAIPSANSIALEVMAQLYHRTGNDEYKNKAIIQIGALSAKIKRQSTAFSYFLMAVQAHNSGEISNVQYGAKGHVRIELSSIIQKKQLFDVEVKVSIDKGWHINSRYPLDKDLIATAMLLDDKIKKNWKISSVEYPEGEEIKLKFSDKSLSLYQNSNTIKLRLQGNLPSDKQDKLVSIPLQFKYQACSESICLAPEVNTLYIFPKSF